MVINIFRKGCYICLINVISFFIISMIFGFCNVFENSVNNLEEKKKKGYLL